MLQLLFLLLLAIPHHVFSFPLTPSSGNFNSTNVRLGWTSSSNTRGTIDIIYSCASTAFLCSWSILNLNVPSIKDSTFAYIRRKLWLTALCFLGPEFILMISGAQWSSARSSWKLWQEAGHKDWTMYHCFFADMGGILFRCVERQPEDQIRNKASPTNSFPDFPIDSKQLLCLVECGVVKRPKLTKTQIQDRNKVDGLLRFITLVQTGWFCVNLVARCIRRLEITTLELTTAAFLICNIATVVFWYYKPADVVTPEVLKTTLPIEEVVRKAEAWMEEHSKNKGDEQHRKINQRHPCYERTPLEFISRKEWDWSLYWGNWLHILRNLRVPMIDFVPKQLPVSRFGNSRVPHAPSTPLYCFLLSLSGVYAGIFVAGWNYSFPTPIEQLLWRISSLTLLGIVFTYWFLSVWGFSVYPVLREKLKQMINKQRTVSENSEHAKSRQWTGHTASIRRRYDRITNAIRNNSVSKDPLLTVPLKIIVPIHILGFLYCVSRTYILISDILELRSLPPSAYVAIEWSDFLPHL